MKKDTNKKIYKKEESDKKEGLTFLYVKVNRKHFIAETESSVLLDIDGDQRVWLNKNYIFPSYYTLEASVSIVKEWEYKVYDDILNKDSYEVIDGEELLDLIKNI